MARRVPLGDDGFVDMEAFDAVEPDELDPGVRELVSTSLARPVDPLDEARWEEVVERATAFDLDVDVVVDDVVPGASDAAEPDDPAAAHVLDDEDDDLDDPEHVTDDLDDDLDHEDGIDVDLDDDLDLGGPPGGEDDPSDFDEDGW